MDWELELKNEQLEQMIHIYQEEVEKLQLEKETLIEEVTFLKLQLEYKTMGPPIHSQEDKKY
tara:strand:- start:417 stop:602 length:186 start_codon:yes stop_codon:yes gene_type:complete